MDLSKLTIIKPVQDPTTKKMESNIQPKQVPQPVQSQTEQNISKIDSINNKYQEVRKGKLNQNDFRRSMLAVDNNIDANINSENKERIKSYLLQTLLWYIQLKVLISTSRKLSDFIESDVDDRLTGYLGWLNEFVEKTNLNPNDPERNLGLYDPKDSSIIIRDLLKVFINDDPIHPKYKIDMDMVMYLANQRPTFLKEINVLFDLYSKVYDHISKDILEDRALQTVANIQPRFEMINRHILSSNLSTRIDYDIDFDKIGIQLPTSEQFTSSQLGLKRRLDFLNDWLNNGIIHTQTSLNRLYGLKPITKENKSLVFDNQSLKSANTKFEIWCILQDTKSFLESLKGLTDGTAFITGMKSIDLLDVLDVNY